jgi:hypothetical protein
LLLGDFFAHFWDGGGEADSGVVCTDVLSVGVWNLQFVFSELSGADEFHRCYASIMNE